MPPKAGSQYALRGLKRSTIWKRYRYHVTVLRHDAATADEASTSYELVEVEASGDDHGEPSEGMECMATMEELEGRECENKLMMLLDFTKFDFIKVLLKNQDRIVYCTKLARAQNDEERADIEEKMAADPKLEPILGELNKQSTKLEKDRALEVMKTQYNQQYMSQKLSIEQAYKQQH